MLVIPIPILEEKELMLFDKVSLFVKIAVARQLKVTHFNFGYKSSKVVGSSS